jgi:hypothetical protein
MTGTTQHSAIQSLWAAAAAMRSQLSVEIHNSNQHLLMQSHIKDIAHSS